MQYTDKEIDLAKKYLIGEYTDVQFNYLMYQNNIDKNKMNNLINYLESISPIATMCKLLLALLFFHFISCFFYFIYCHIN